MEMIKYLQDKLKEKDQILLNTRRKFGRIFEQFIPFSKNFYYDKSKFKFLGQPIDGIVFGDDKIVFLEFKTGKGYLTPNQEKIKELIHQGKVEFKELKY
jgi:predicted Holliday junction resolvase-like endonuclease